MSTTNLFSRNTNFDLITDAHVSLVLPWIRGATLMVHSHLAASMIPYGSLFTAEGLHTPECVLIVDSGFSFTHVVPMINHQIQWHAVKR